MAGTGSVAQGGLAVLPHASAPAGGWPVAAAVGVVVFSGAPGGAAGPCGVVFQKLLGWPSQEGPSAVKKVDDTELCFPFWSLCLVQGKLTIHY